jgi:hypothetical protein
VSAPMVFAVLLVTGVVVIGLLALVALGVLLRQPPEAATDG